MTSTSCYLLLGDSLTAGFDTAALLPELVIANQAVSGDSTVELLERLQPAWLHAGLRAVAVCIGTNDLARDRTDAFILAQLERIIDALQAPGLAYRVVLTSLFPTRHNAPRPNARIVALNVQLASLARRRGVDFFYLNPYFRDADGELRAEFTDDGLHLTAAAYQRWADKFRALVAELPAPARTATLPM